MKRSLPYWQQDNSAGAAPCCGAKDMEIEMMDFDNAFLNGDLEEEVYMQAASGL